MSKILGFGNPLLDISATVEQTVLDEWGASLNNAILAEEKHQPLCESAAAAASARVQRALSVAFRRAQTRSSPRRTRWTTLLAARRSTRSAWRSGC